MDRARSRAPRRAWPRGSCAGTVRSLRDVEVADQLHRDRRAALHGLVAREVLDRGAHDALVVDALVLVEALVLDRDRRVLERTSGSGRAGTGWRSSLDWMKPRRVPSAARTSDCEPEVARLERVERRRGGGDRDHVADRGEAGECDEHQHDHHGEEGLVPRATAAAAASPVALRPAHLRARPIRARTIECSPAGFAYEAGFPASSPSSRRRLRHSARSSAWRGPLCGGGTGSPTTLMRTPSCVTSSMLRSFAQHLRARARRRPPAAARPRRRARSRRSRACRCAGSRPPAARSGSPRARRTRCAGP